jgi:apurinic endonuclease APN1
VVEKFLALCKEHNFKEYYVHAPYLVNLASPNNRVRHGSISLLRKTLEAASLLKVAGVMFHPGSAKDQPDRETGIQVAIESLNKILDGYTGSSKLLIENAAGSGNTIGVNFKEVGQLLTGITDQTKAGVCLDTQHAFGSGYDWRTTAGTAAAAKEFQKEIGFKNLMVIQANDSKVECGSNKDRHDHIKTGLMGKAAWTNLLHHPKFKTKSFVLETEPDGRADDIKKLNKPVIACCRSGMRSGQATSILKQNGIECINGGGWNSLAQKL